MSVKIGINGFGRIGRLVFRTAYERDDIEIVGINDIGDAETMATLLKYDSSQGRFPGDVSYDKKDGKYIIVDGKQIPLCAERDPANLPWKKLGAEVIIEATGLFKTKETASKHIKAGAKKVLISAPAKDIDGMFVLGVNGDDYDAAKHDVISIGSCTTNCLAPVAKVLLESFGIEKGLMTTTHAYTAGQKLIDAPHKDLRRARSAAVSMIPTTTGAARAVALVIPELKGKFDGCAIRVPTPTGSIVDLAVILEKEVTVEDVNKAMKTAAEGPLKGILEYCTDPIVSIDIVHNPHSSIFDSLMTMADGKFIKVFSWYDNEWGFSNRMVDMVSKMMG
ncbi:MAG: type I glyceraldehyde-3-phosphate dehydrogenase [candidate division Zixibacteria bacterium]|nr:type I glyceraldehyde-3-phosphate dehydrogenase [candidate division Zixibacteria bacterium]